jgi:hypothetical protein
MPVSLINELTLSIPVMTLSTILLASFVFLSWLSYSFSILTTEEPYLLISVMIHSLATQAAYAAPWGVRNVGINLFTVSRIW